MRYLIELEYITIVPAVVEADSEAEVRIFAQQDGPTEELSFEVYGDPAPQPPRLLSVKPLGD